MGQWDFTPRPSGQRGIVVTCICPSVRLSLCKLYLACTLTCHRFHLKPRNLTCILVNSQLILKIWVIHPTCFCLNHEAALIWLMAWCFIGTKPSAKPVFTQLIGAEMLHKSENSEVWCLPRILIHLQISLVNSDPYRFSWCNLIHCDLSSDTICRQRSGSTLAEVMAWCLVAPSHYPNQCWLN